MKRIWVVLVGTVLLAGIESSWAASGEWVLWSDQPASKWLEAYPVGNGSMGGMVFGGVVEDRIQVNLDTLFSAFPHDYAHEGAAKKLPEIRRLLFDGKQKEAEALAMKEFMSVSTKNTNRQEAYQPFVDLVLQFPGEGEVEAYRRDLDLEEAFARMRYRRKGITFQRDVLASYPDGVLVVRLDATRPSSVNVKAFLTSPHSDAETVALGPQTLALKGKVQGGDTRFEARLMVRVGGDHAVVACSDTGISVEDADVVTLILAGASSFVNYRDIGGDPAKKNLETLRRLQDKPYDQIRQDHLADQKSLFNRVRIDLGPARHPELPTAERVRAYKMDDRQLEALFFQYARYLLIASSRPGSQPANLQGIWNDSLKPPWDSKWTININTEMNYWLADVMNLAECNEPLFAALRDLTEAGAKVAKEHYGARGWVAHHNFDLWRGAAPINNANHGIWPTGGAWLCQHLWWHYQFSGDREFLRNQAYPILKSAALFFVDTLVEDPRSEKKWLISGPSNSPEQGGLVMGPTMDHQIIRALFGWVIEANQLLDTDAGLRRRLETLRARIAPNRIGKHGQLQEWLEDLDDPNNHHRHLSHLWGVYPGEEITPRATPKLAEAARISLDFRGDGPVGWGRAWQVGLYARLRDGDTAFDRYAKLVGRNTFPNLFNKCWDNRDEVFQIDGNFGGPAGVAEMLLQSHEGIIDLLPALPHTWSEGMVEGLRARGGIEVDMRWKGGKLTSFRLTSNSDLNREVRWPGGEREVNLKKGKPFEWLNPPI